MFLNPALTIIDGVVAMDGAGPISGRTRPLGWFISGTDPIACETICGELVNIEPRELPIVKTARQMGVGCCDPEEVRVLGDNLSKNVCADFELAEPIPLRFTLPRICKSVVKQIILLAKSALNKVK